MRYKLTEHIVSIEDDIKQPVTSFSVESFFHATQISFNEFDQSTLIIGIQRKNLPKVTPKGKWPYKLYRKRIDESDLKIFYNNYCNEAIPFGTNGLIAMDIGGGLAIIDSTGQVIETARFGVAKPVNSQITVNPSNSKISMVRWKGDEKKLMIFDLKTSEFKYYPPTMFDYTWLNDDEIAMTTYGSGYKVLNTSTGKTSKLSVEFDKMIPKILPQIPFDLKRENDPDISKSGIYSLIVHDARMYMYFETWVSSNSQQIKSLRGIVSTKLDQTDLILEYHTFENLRIRDFQVDSQRGICAYVEFNPDANNREWRHVYLNGIHDSQWVLIPSNHCPKTWDYSLFDFRDKDYDATWKLRFSVI